MDIIKAGYNFSVFRNSKEEIGKSAAPINQLNNVPLYGYITFYPFIS